MQRIVYKEEADYVYGRAVKNENTIYVNNSLPKWARLSTVVHELYHLEDDKAQNQLWREIRATFAQLFIPFLGGIYCIFKTITTPSRIKFTIKRFIRK